MASLANYKLQLHYKTGKINVEADVFSRILWKAAFHIQTVKAIIDTGCSNYQALLETYPRME